MLRDDPAPLCSFGTEEMMYPTMVGRIAEAQKKNENKLIEKMYILEANERGITAERVAIPNPMQTQTEFLFSYPPSFVETRPPKEPPRVGPKTEADP